MVRSTAARWFTLLVAIALVVMVAGCNCCL
jgi:hypothetical protein